MSETAGCCRCCCSFICTLGLTAFFMWLSLRASKPKCSIEYFYVPALNKSLVSNQPNITTTNSTIFFHLRLTNPNNDKGIYYDALNLSFYYQPPNATNSTAAGSAVGNFQLIGNKTFQLIGNKTIIGFRQGKNKKANKKDSVDARGVDWKAVSNSKTTVVFRVDLVTAVRFRIVFWKTKRHKIKVGANVEVKDDGLKIHKKGVKLKSGASKQGCYRALVLGTLVIIFTLFMF